MSADGSKQRQPAKRSQAPSQEAVGLAPRPGQARALSPLNPVVTRTRAPRFYWLGKYRGPAIAAILASHPITAVCDEMPVGSVVAFNTQCARCHEGECSGRLSFQLSEDAADEHIRRHGGPLPLQTVRDLDELLRYMKERCAFYPMPLALANDRRWDKGTLDLLRNLEGAAYFLPLGRLGSGVYRLRMDGLAPGLRICSELVAADFDLVSHEVLTQDGGVLVLRFRVDAPAELFLRIRTPVPATLTQVDLATEPGKSDSSANEHK